MTRIIPTAITNHKLSYDVIALSYKKNTHSINQDAFSINNVISEQSFESFQVRTILKNLCYLAVSDGVSHSNNGSEAAKKSVSLFSQGYSFENINHQLLNNYSSPCTLSTLTLSYDLAISQSVGDSLLILVRNKKIQYLSFKQNYQTRMNFLTKQKIKSNILEHYLANDKFDVLNTNLNYFKVYPGDVIYLLTDGYEKILSPRRFKKLIKKQQLIKYLQNYHGKFNDDTTVIKVKIRGA